MRDYANYRNRTDFDRACIAAASVAGDTGIPHLVYWGGLDDGYMVVAAHDVKAYGLAHTPPLAWAKNEFDCLVRRPY